MSCGKVELHYTLLYAVPLLNVKIIIWWQALVNMVMDLQVLEPWVLILKQLLL
jgi:hypothetical protein